MRVCEKCGFEANRDTARFCARCGQTLSAERHALLSAGTVLHDRYRVVRALGKGGMGAVYLVKDQELYGKHWAVKELLEHFSDPAERAEAVTQFQREVQILVGLRHPNLPQVVDAFEESGRHYLVMEFIEGQTLEEIMKATPGDYLPEEQVLNWVAQVCDVLDYLHKHDPPVIFRDLKPANVMITPQGQVKLIDFGVARLFDPAKGTDTLKMGTVGYAPPEQYAGKGQTTPRSDVYALGATLYQIFTGDSPEAHPFVFTSVRRLNRKISARTARAIAKAVELDPGDRFPSARALEAALLGRKRRSLPMFLIGLPLLLLVAAGGWWLWQNDPWGWRTAEATPTPQEVVIAETTPSPTGTRRPTSTPAPTLTPTPAPPTDTPSPTPTASPTPTPTSTPTSAPLPTPTQESRPSPTPTPATPLSSPTPSPLPAPAPGETGRIFYTIKAGEESYYLASTDPSWSQGQMVDAAAYEHSTCSGASTAKTLVGQTVNLFYGYRCPIGHPQECPSPDGAYKVTIWQGEGGYSLSIYRVSDGEMLHAPYTGNLNREEPLLWAPDSSRFYFTIDRTLHQASPHSDGYQPVLPIAYETYLSPDGSMFLYLQPVGTVGAYDVWVANADGSNPRNVTNAPETHKLCARWGGY